MVASMKLDLPPAPSDKEDLQAAKHTILLLQENGKVNKLASAAEVHTVD